MSVTITLSSPVPSTIPTEGWKVEYRPKGSSGAYTTAIGSPFMGLPIVFTIAGAIAGDLFEGHIWRDCGPNESTMFNWSTPCDCLVEDYVDSGHDTCEKTTDIPATSISSPYCFAHNPNTIYSLYGSRIYKPGFNSHTLIADSTDAVDVNIDHPMLTAAPQWKDSSPAAANGPGCRECVWVDTDCEGHADALAVDKKVTITAQYFNSGAPRTMYLGAMGDNDFKIIVNGDIIVDTGVDVPKIGYVGTSPTAEELLLRFKIWHLVPITTKSGVNHYNLITRGDGTVNDSMAMVLYDNTAAQLRAATSDGPLTIIFKSSLLIGTTFKVAECPDDYTMYMSGVNPRCVKVEVMDCNTTGIIT